MIECSNCKAHNQDRSLYCLECGQRLKAKFPDPANSATASLTSSGRLHSPILDLGEQQVKRNKGTNIQFGTSEHIELNNSHSNSISRNGLHSPLLDGKNYFANPYPNSNRDPDPNPIPAANGSVDKTRLHSPVLDGPY